MAATYRRGMNPNSRIGGFKKGHSVPQEWREAGRRANLGAKRHTTLHSSETKMKISMSRKGKTAGENNPAWKGGKRSADYIERRKFQRSIQKKVFERDNYTCQLCTARGVDLQVDHIQSWAEYVELRFDINNCRTLCMKCHYQITFGKPMSPTVRAWGHNFSRRALP